MIVTCKLLPERHLEFLSLKGGCRGSSESTHVKMPLLLEISCTGSLLPIVWRCVSHKTLPPTLKVKVTALTQTRSVLACRVGDFCIAKL